jgi:probable aminopeptidase NPEPL1
MSYVVTTLPAPAPSGCATLVLVGRAGALLTPQARALLPSGIDPKAWEQMVQRTEATDVARSTTTWRDGQPSQVAAVVLPKACSRHNSESRAWAITQGLAALRTSGTVDVVLCVTEAGHATASALAAARALPRHGRAGSQTERTARLSALGPDGSIDLTPLQPAVDGVRLAAQLVDRPPNDLNVDAFVAEARSVAERTGCRIDVLRDADLTEAGLGGLHAVGKAAEQSPALVVLDHGEGDGGEAWIGKGIVYDTGGLSIKTKTGMPGMKSDMGGAAAVLAAFEAAVRLGVSRRLTAVLCIAENAVGPGSTRPDDVITLYSGRSVEVNNTDAEGRLVLADGLAWCARNRRPARMIDLATLTGAQMVATGQQHAALYASDGALEAEAVSTGRRVGELCHPLPYAPELFRREFTSAIADMKNSVKNRSNAQSSCAGQFIGNHLGEHLEGGGTWLHVDMAGPSTRSGRGTGYGVGLLLGLVGGV